jgi:predicted phosphodiesterase
MIKKVIRVMIITILVGALLYGIGRLGVVVYDSYVYVDRQPYLQMQTEHSVIIKWQTPAIEIGCVRYGKTALSEKVCEEEASRYHLVRLEQLEKNSQYHYMVDSASLKIDPVGRTFKTLHDDANQTQRIWVLGDSGNFNEAQQDVRKAMYAHLDGQSVDIWMMLGDNAYRSGTQKQFNQGLFRAFPEMSKSNALWSVIGNHDARRWAYYDIVEHPTNGESGGEPSGSEKYYAFNNGNVHFVMLDSQTEDLGAEGAMARWLEKDLQANQQRWTIVAFHHPPYSKGSHDSDDHFDSGGRMIDMREHFVPILEKYDVDLVLSGHSHTYERSSLLHGHYGPSSTFDPAVHVVQSAQQAYTKCIDKTPYAGTLFVVAGSSSVSYEGLNPFDAAHPAMLLSFYSSGSLLLSVNADELTGEFVMRDGTLVDTFTLTKSSSYCEKREP